MLFKELLKEGNGKSIKYDYGCLMLYFKPKFWSKLLSFIDEGDLYDNEESDFGLEQKTHITVLFGFNLDTLNREMLKKDMEQLSPISATLTAVSKFDRSEKEYEVLKFDVNSKQLHSVNNFFRKKYDYVNDYPEYHPHCTIAYLKKGTADKYIKKFKKIKNIEFKSNHFVFTGNSSEDKIDIHVKDTFFLKEEQTISHHNKNSLIGKLVHVTINEHIAALSKGLQLIGEVLFESKKQLRIACKRNTYLLDKRKISYHLLEQSIAPIGFVEDSVELTKGQDPYKTTRK